MTDTLTAPSVCAPTDLRDLNATLALMHRAERAVTTMAAYVAEAGSAVAAAPDDPEVKHAFRMAELRMRADAFALAQDFATMAQPNGA